MLDNERTLVELKRRIILIVRARKRMIIADNPCDNGDRFRAGFMLVVRGRFGDTLPLRQRKGLSLYGEWFRRWGWRRVRGCPARSCSRTRLRIWSQSRPYTRLP